MKNCILILISSCAAWAQASRPVASEDFEIYARKVHENALILDAHIDTPYWLTRHYADISQRQNRGHFDFVRAREGGLDASAFVVYVASRYNDNGAFAQAQRILAMIANILTRNNGAAELARSPEEVRRFVRSGKHAMLLGLENGSAIENDLANVRKFAEQGICYVTLTHSKDNHISDSSYDRAHTHKGLSVFGKQVVREMNRLGVMVDVSHISDEAFWQVLAITQAPVIASHSSVRALRRISRNLSDSMLVALQKNGGVVFINFGSFFLSQAYQNSVSAQERKLAEAQQAFKHDETRLQRELAEIRRAYPIVNAALTDLIKHIDYAVKLIGIDHVGFGSDYDGIDVVPLGLEDVSMYPKITRELLRMGYSEDDICKLAGENFLRVWAENLRRRAQD